jgi:hypothetical protein
MRLRSARPLIISDNRVPLAPRSSLAWMVVSSLFLNLGTFEGTLGNETLHGAGPELGTYREHVIPPPEWYYSASASGGTTVSFRGAAKGSVAGVFLGRSLVPTDRWSEWEAPKPHATYTLSTSPRYWRAVPWSVLGRFLLGPEARADETSSPSNFEGILKKATPDNLSQILNQMSPDAREKFISELKNRLAKPEEDGGGGGAGAGGGGGGGGGGVGSQLAGLAYGVAAIIAAAQPAVAAAIQAAADKKIAQITATSQEKMTNKVAQTEVDTGKLNVGKAANADQTAKDLQFIQEQGSLARTAKELDAAKDARRDNLAEEGREFDAKASFQKAEIKIAKDSAQATEAQALDHFKILSSILANIAPKANQASLSVKRVSSSDGNAQAVAGMAPGRAVSTLSILKGSTRNFRQHAPTEDLALAAMSAPNSKATTRRISLQPIPRQSSDSQSSHGQAPDTSDATY